jgi:hypothetical protein
MRAYDPAIGGRSASLRCVVGEERRDAAEQDDEQPEHDPGVTPTQAGDQFGGDRGDDQRPEAYA